MPDAKFRILYLTSNGKTFKAKLKITGTHKQKFPFLKKGGKAIKPTGKKINKIITSVEIILRGDKIIELRNLEPGKGVIAGLLDELQVLPGSYSAN